MTFRNVIFPILALWAVAAGAKSDKSDPTVMTVAGKRVPLSEFSYLYHKNAAQQAEAVSLDRYIDMFVDYKLKVADAEAAGIDTTEAFRRELDGYRREIAATYMTDHDLVDSLRNVALGHYACMVDVSHIMFPTNTPDATVDSVYSLLAGGADFADIAARMSIDRPSAVNGGRMGWITAGRFPYTFEDTAWDTPEGSFSKPIRTPMGRHIVKVNGRRTNPGQVHVRHILKMTRNLDPASASVKRAEIDSIATLLATGADFAAIASAETDDPSGRTNGGDLPWFGPGEMVPEFETAAFALEPGRVSGVVESAFGFHIIKCEERREGISAEEASARTDAMMNRDGRSALGVRRWLDRFVADNPSLTDAPDSVVTEAALAHLAAVNPDYRNLLNEYRDGMLLFEMSNREVWGRAAADTAGVNAMFEACRERYAYDGTPRYKGHVIVAEDDSIADAAFRLLTFSTVKPDEYNDYLRNELGKGVRIERVLAARGENAVIDCIVWGAPTPPASGRWTAWRAFGGRIIDAPETAADTDGAAAADYQAELEAAWIKRLHDTYPVKINRKALRKLQ